MKRGGLEAARVVVLTANITLRRGGIWNLAQTPLKNFKTHWNIWRLTEKFENSRGASNNWQICMVKYSAATLPVTPGGDRIGFGGGVMMKFRIVCCKLVVSIFLVMVRVWTYFKTFCYYDSIIWWKYFNLCTSGQNVQSLHHRTVFSKQWNFWLLTVAAKNSGANICVLPHYKSQWCRHIAVHDGVHCAAHLATIREHLL